MNLYPEIGELALCALSQRFREVRKHHGTGLDQNDSRFARINIAKVGIKNIPGQFSKRSRKLNADAKCSAS